MMNREARPDGLRRGGRRTTALQAIPAAKPDILIVDISLNGPDGLELLKNIRVTLSQPAGA